jgi:glycine cleavage system H protein
MSKIPDDLRYTEDHEYVKTSADPAIVQVGITDHAQSELGDVVYVELPKPGAALGRGEAFGTIEAVKAVSDLLTPLAGTVTEVNATLAGDPALVNRDPYGDGWMIKLRVKSPAELKTLLGSAEYKKHVGE